MQDPFEFFREAYKKELEAAARNDPHLDEIHEFREWLKSEDARNMRAKLDAAKQTANLIAVIFALVIAAGLLIGIAILAQVTT